MSWLFSRALVAASLGEGSSDGEPCAQLNVMPTPQPFSHSAKTTPFSTPSQFGLTCARLTAADGEGVLTWFLGASLVRTSAQPGAGPAWRVRDLDCGWKWPGSSAKFDPVSRSWKTRQSLLLGDSEPFSETWPRSGWMRDGELLPLPSAELPTSANASGFWPTPVAQDDNKSPAAHMAMKRRMKGGPRNTITSLQVAAKAWATPAARDHFPAHTEEYVAAKRAEGHGMRNLTDEAMAHGPTENLSPDATEPPGSLNPEFHLWLMGWPEGWTACEPLETAKFQSWLEKHGAG